MGTPTSNSDFRITHLKKCTIVHNELRQRFPFLGFSYVPASSTKRPTAEVEEAVIWVRGYWLAKITWRSLGLEILRGPHFSAGGNPPKKSRDPWYICSKFILEVGFVLGGGCGTSLDSYQKNRERERERERDIVASHVAAYGWRFNPRFEVSYGHPSICLLGIHV